MAAVAASHLRPAKIERAVFVLPAAFLLIGMLLISDGGLKARVGLAGSFVYAGDYLCRALIYWSVISTSHNGNGPSLVGRVALATLFILVGRLAGQALGIACASTDVLFFILTVAIVVSLLVLAAWTAHQKPAVQMQQAQSSQSSDGHDLESACRTVACRVARRYMLTEREEQVLSLILQGLSAKSIGAELSLAPSTVKSHMDRIYKKTNVHTRDELIVLAQSSDA